MLFFWFAQCDLVNGTDVIVSTPCTFIRMLESGHTNVKRLCHLFIDDADIITKEFPKQVSALPFCCCMNSGDLFAHDINRYVCGYFVSGGCSLCPSVWAGKNKNSQTLCWYKIHLYDISCSCMLVTVTWADVCQPFGHITDFIVLEFPDPLDQC